VIGPTAVSAFEKGSTLHGVTVLACLAAVAGAVWLGRHWRAVIPEREHRLRIAWVFFVVTFQIASQVWQNVPGNLDVEFTLPLHLCDLVACAVPFALLGRWRFPRALLYFWGAGLSVFAFLLPILREGPGHVAFWLFWIGHTQILGSAVYLVAVQRWRPALRDVGVAFVTTAVYILLVLPLDVALGVDYGSVGPGRSSTALLGPWPLRVFVLLVLEGVLFVLMWLPWRKAGGGGTVA
jgi:hypothetical integral membrane protein (TIGR02206 family)